MKKALKTIMWILILFITLAPIIFTIAVTVANNCKADQFEKDLINHPLPKYENGTYTEPEVCVPDGTDSNVAYNLYDDIYNIPSDDNVENDTVENTTDKTIITLPVSENNCEFVFSSGAGAWATHLKLNNDGSFVGSFHDAEMGEIGEGYPLGCYYTCDFSGNFKNIEKINEYSYKMTLDNITTKHTPGEEWIENGVKNIATGPYGLEGGNEFILYLPETPAAETPLGFLTWWPLRYGQIDESGEIKDPEATLFCYGICNMATTEGFFTYN